MSLRLVFAPKFQINFIVCEDTSVQHVKECMNSLMLVSVRTRVGLRRRICQLNNFT